MDRKYWAQRGNRKLGPFTSRGDAEEAGQALFPKKIKHNDTFMCGYGEFGPSFDIRFVHQW